MSRTASKPKQSRTRYSDKTFRKVLQAMREEGVPVGNVWIRGGEVEIQVGAVAARQEANSKRGPKSWD